jgi:hypothetical protein
MKKPEFRLRQKNQSFFLVFLDVEVMAQSINSTQYFILVSRCIFTIF